MTDETDETEDNSTPPIFIDADQFRNDGWLQEVNRLFFHPRRAALELIGVDDSADGPSKWMASVIKHSEYARDQETDQEIIEKWNHFIESLKKGFLVLVRDYEHQGGVEFGPPRTEEHATARRARSDKMRARKTRIVLPDDCMFTVRPDDADDSGLQHIP